MGKKHFLFLSNRPDREPNPDSGVKGSSANRYPRAPALMFAESNSEIAQVVIDPRGTKTYKHVASGCNLLLVKGKKRHNLFLKEVNTTNLLFRMLQLYTPKVPMTNTICKL